MYKYSKTTGCFYPNDIEYAELPDDLIEASAEEYAAAMNRAVGELLDVEAGRLIILPAPPNAYSVWEAGAWREDAAKKEAVEASEALAARQALQAEAQAAMSVSDRVVVRCAEAEVRVPEAWRTYRTQLRRIIMGEAIEAIPSRPPYPQGT